MHTLTALLMSIATANATDTAPPADSTQLIKELQDQVQRLKEQVDALTAQSDDNWLTQQRADEIRGLVQDVLADADTRASLLESGAVAGYDKGFFIGSSDGNFLLKVAGQMQVRFVYNHQDNPPPPPFVIGDVDDNRYGFEIRRAKLFLSGNIVDPSWEYQFEIEADRSTGTVVTGEFVYIQKDLGNGWKIRAGQFKPPYLREEFVSSRRLMLVERSLLNSQFTAGISQGVWLSYEADQWRAYATFNDGNNTRSAPWNAQDTEYALTGRAEWLAAGPDWKAVDDYDGWRNSETSVLLGAGVDYQNDEYGTGVPPIIPNNAEVNNLGVTFDATLKLSGFSIAGEFIYRNLEINGTPGALDQLGFLIQGGFFLAEDLETVARYEWGDLDNPTIDDLSIVTVGINKYYSGHNLKWQNDIGYSFEPVSSSWAQTSAGWRTDAPGEDGQIVIRSQLQLLF
ncbi:MAG: OprO/OprP family phosphate-selective porin [Phycisphaerales bacterium]|nr:OprO/OprP family phosphate-selective porin [Phycisphaerales bacterium]